MRRNYHKTTLQSGFYWTLSTIFCWPRMTSLHCQIECNKSHPRNILENLSTCPYDITSHLCSYLFLFHKDIVNLFQFSRSAMMSLGDNEGLWRHEVTGESHSLGSCMYQGLVWFSYTKWCSYNMENILQTIHTNKLAWEGALCEFEVRFMFHLDHCTVFHSVNISPC